MSPIHDSPSARPACLVVTWCAFLLTIAGLVHGSGLEDDADAPAWLPASSGLGRPTDLACTVSRDAWRIDWVDRCVVPADVCGPPGATPSRQASELLELVRFVRSEPDLGAPLLATAWDHGVPICLDDRPEGLLGAYDLDHGLVVLNETLTLHERAVVLVHELRHVEATARGLRPSLAYAMSDTVAMRLALEADAQAVATLYAWKAAELGYDAVWNALSGLDRHADVAGAFERSFAASGSVRIATQAAFRDWYASPERVGTYRRNACMDYLDALDASKAVQSYEAIPPDALDGLGRLPSGHDYAPWLPIHETRQAREGAANATSPPSPPAP